MTLLYILAHIVRICIIVHGMSTINKLMTIIIIIIIIIIIVIIIIIIIIIIKNFNLRNLQSLENLQFYIFGLCHLNIWIWFVQTLGTSCVYTRYLENGIVPACFSQLVLTLILVNCILFFSLFSTPFSGSTVFLSALLFIWSVLALPICTYGMPICRFEIVFCISKFNLLTSVLSQKSSHLLFSVFCL